MCQYNVDQREWELKELGTNVGAGSPWPWNPIENLLTVLRNFAAHRCCFCSCGNWPTNSIQLFRGIGIALVRIYEFLNFWPELITSDVDQIKSRYVTFCTNDIISK